MEFGIFTLMQQRNSQKSPKTIFSEALEQTVLADELGFATAWYPEHHFSNYSMCPSPLVLAAHAASLTKKIRLGAGVVVAPLYNPARLMSEICLVDILSDGRLDVGVGYGYQDYEFRRFGVDLKNAKAATHEMLDILELGLSGKMFSYSGKHYQFPESTISLKPLQKPMPPLWFVGTDPDLFRRAIRGNHSVFTTGFLGNWKRLGGLRQTIDDICRAEGVPTSAAKVAYQRFAFVSDNKREVEHYVDCARYQQRLGVSLRRRSESVDNGYMIAEVPFEDELPFEKMLENIPVGDAETVIERLVREIRVMRPRHVAIQTHPGDMDHRTMMKQIELLGTEILPAVLKEVGDLNE